MDGLTICGVNAEHRPSWVANNAGVLDEAF